MSTSLNKESKDETRIGEYAATQPLSGIKLVTAVRVKAGVNTTFSSVAEPTKKAG